MKTTAVTVVTLVLAALLLAAASPQAARIDSITPAIGVRGDQVTITGIGFGAGNVRISVGGVAASVVAATGNRVTFRVPFGVRPGPTTVTATNPGGHAGIIAFTVINRAPQANAGFDQTVFVTTSVQLDGRASSDADGDPLTYHWSFVSRPDGSHAALNDPSAVRPTFTADLAGHYSLRLVVNDSFADSAPATVSIDTQNSPPVASAGLDQTVFVGSTVRLDGSGSFDVDHDPLTFHWSFVSRPAGSQATLVNDTTPGAAFTVDLPGRYAVQLVVNDGTVDSRSDTVSIDTRNSRPVADAGADRTVLVGETVQLDGSESFDVDDDPLTFRWSFVSRPTGSTAALSDVAAPAPTFVADALGLYVVQLIVNDSTLDSAPDTVAITAEARPINQPPSVDAGADQTITLPGAAALTGTVTDDGLPPGSSVTVQWSKVSGPGSAIFANARTPHTTATFSDAGTYVLRLTASDGQLAASDDVTVTVNSSVPVNAAPSVNAGPDQTVTLPDSASLAGTVTDDGLPTGSTLTIAWSTISGPGAVTFANASAASTIATFATSGPYVLRLTASDGDLSSSADVRVTVNPASSGGGTGGLPPDPATVAPPVDASIATGIGRSTQFLYSGPNPIQVGVAAGTIEAKRAAVVRGRVLTRDGVPLPGAKITVLGHPELGSTLTRTDGMFDLAVNGGGTLTVRYDKANYLPAQRQVTVPWQDYVFIPDVALVAFDVQVTTVNLAAPIPVQVARGNPVSDAEGTRQSTLLVPQGTSATMMLADGTTQPIATLNIRATEYTVGPMGRAAMPGELPPTSGYTYAVELSADEAVAAGARTVQFSQPLIHYVENFLGFPVGGIVPVGYYDRERAAWVPSDNGRVIKILGVSNSLADIDVDGAGAAAGATALAELGITDAERERLAALYQPGQSLWRAPITHFTPFDENWPYGPPADATPPNQPAPARTLSKDGCTVNSSIVGCQNQTLGEAVALTGTPFHLRYQSDRVPGRREAFGLTVPLSGASVPGSLKRIELEIAVAGQGFAQSFPPAPGQAASFTWNGQDVYGRTVQGAQTITTRVGYVYDAVYQSPAQAARSFAAVSERPGVAVTGGRTRQELTVWQQNLTTIGAWDARAFGLGGWGLNVHHAYDPAARVLHLGDGRDRSAEASGRVIGPFAGNGLGGFTGGPATRARIGFPTGLAAAPDGTVFVASTDRSGVGRISPTGDLQPYGGFFLEFSGLGGLALAADGTLYVSQAPFANFPGTGHRVFAIPANRDLGTGPLGPVIAGRTGNPGFSGDGGPATEALLSSPRGIALGPDGTLYIADQGNNRVRAVTPDGIIRTVAGNGDFGPYGNGGQAAAAALSNPVAVAVGPDGSLYIGELSGGQIRRVGLDGIITTVAGGGVEPGDGGPATAANIGNPRDIAFDRNGTLLILELDGFVNGTRLRAVTPDGIINTIAGAGGAGAVGDNVLATQASLINEGLMALTPEGGILLSQGSDNRIRRISPSLPGFDGTNILLASEDGAEVYQFDATGRHLRTLDTFTGTALLQFAYDGAGRLATVTDASGNVTTIARDGSGIPTAVVAPGGQQTTLTLDGGGFLATIANPASQAVRLASTTDGLLTSLTDPRGGLHQFTYDASGRLTRDQRPDGAITLDRTETPNGFTVTMTTATGQMVNYETERLATGGIRRATVDPRGGRTEVVIGTEGTQTGTYPDGAQITLVTGTDSRFGPQVPTLRSLTVTTPTGRTTSVTSQRTITLANPSDPFSLRTLTQTTTVDGRTFTATYDAGTRTLTHTSPGGRQVIETLDAQGRVTSKTPGTGLAPIAVTYDTLGRVSRLDQGNQSSSYDYDAHYRVIAHTDAGGRQTQYAYDAADRITALTLPSGHVYRFAYDASGNRTGITLPSRALHTLAYTAADLQAGYTPPANGTYGRLYDLDRRLVRQMLPGGRVVDHAYDAGGRPSGLEYAEAAVGFAYAAGDPTDRASAITRTPTGGGMPQGLALSYDRDLVTGTIWSGVADGQFSYTYGPDSFLTRITLASGSDLVELPLARDVDALLTGYGPFVVTRDGPGATPSRIMDSTFVADLTYDGLGRVTGRTHTVAGQIAYQAQFTYDNAGRVVQKAETVAGISSTSAYTYDADGQLTEVTRDGVVVERYAYDPDGNRTSSQVGTGSAEIASYDVQDRLSQRGAVTYRFDADGFLAERGRDTFRFSARGELIEATGGGQTITYAHDGLGRRVGRTDAAGTAQYFYGNPGNPFQVTHARDTDGVLTTFYYDEAGLLFALERGGARYYAATDQVGTPRVVTDAGGVVVKIVERDSFGRLLSDSNPAFALPIGFASGLADDATGLVRFGFRDYEPATGRWTARDPALFGGGQGNLYAYVRNDPASLRDPTGLFCVGGSIYEGAGFGFQLCYAGGGLSVCGEAGGGFGGGLDVDPFRGLAAAGNDLVGEAGLKCGLAKLTVSAKLDHCGDVTINGKRQVGEDIRVNPDEPGVTLFPVKGKGVFNGSCSLSAKIAGRSCVQPEWADFQPLSDNWVRNSEPLALERGNGPLFR
jgi:RHS repeat-associated protein